MASFCTVTGQVVDPQGRPYINASLVVVFIPAPTATLAPTLGFIRTFQTVFAEANCDATGRFVRSGLANNTLINDGHAPSQQSSQWCFRFYTAQGYVPQIGFSWCGVINGDMDITAQLAAVAPPIIPPCGGGGGGGGGIAPIITGLNPNMGPAGTTVTITGSGFGAIESSSTTVTFNGIPAAVTSWSNTSIVATVPTGATTGNVVVTTANGASNGVTFTVTTPPPVGPVLTAINPTSGTAGTNVNITLTGTGLTGTTAVNASNFVTVSNVVVVSDTTITATLGLPTPAGGTVTSNITVTTPAGTSNALMFSVTSSIVGPPTGGTTFQLVSITGGVTVPDGTYAGQPGISLFCATAWSPSVTVNVGAQAYVQGTGSYDGYFTIAGISTGPDNFGMTLLAASNANTNIVIQQGSIILGGTAPTGPTLTTITPASSAANTAVVVTLAGSGFTGATQVNYSGTGITRANLQISSDTSLSTTFGISLSATSGNVSVTTPAGTTNTVPFSVTAAVPPAGPLINSVTPTSGAPGSNASITIAGSGFLGNPAIAPTTVGYSGTGVTISNVVVVNDTSITATLAIAATGATSGHLTVTTPSGTSNGASFAVSGAAPPTTPAGYPSFIFGGITIVGGTHAGQRGIYASMQTPLPATAVAGASVTTSGTGSYDGTYVIASASGTDLILVAGTNNATTIISKQGIIQFP